MMVIAARSVLKVVIMVFWGEDLMPQVPHHPQVISGERDDR
jgi:hypothetical protein